VFIDRKRVKSKIASTSIQTGETKWTIQVESKPQWKASPHSNVCCIKLLLHSFSKKKYDINYAFDVLGTRGEIVLQTKSSRKSCDAMFYNNDWDELFTFDDFLQKRSQVLDDEGKLNIECKVKQKSSIYPTPLNVIFF
jgi:hypothetical protein